MVLIKLTRFLRVCLLIISFVYWLYVTQILFEVIFCRKRFSSFSSMYLASVDDGLLCMGLPCVYDFLILLNSFFVVIYFHFNNFLSILWFFYSLLLELQGDTSAALEAYETMLGSMETTSDLTEVWCR